jgi:hypothetical protein
VPPAFRQVLLALFATTTLHAQGAARDTTSKPPETPPISDNSFFIEESYNQDPGVVQHISGFTRTLGSKDWSYTFTQEWPAPGRRHQFSYTIPLGHLGDPSATGVGDLMLNYRLQAVDDDKLGLAISPRLSVSLPTGNEKKGLGLGGTGYQVDLPLSKTLGPSFVAHTNVGATWFPRAPGAGDASTTLIAVNLGQSFVWLARPRFNVLLETFWTRTTTGGQGVDHNAETAFVSPGVRWSYNFTSGLQVVPGIAYPIGVGASRGTHQLFLYLSFEHPFTAAARPQAK